jgi:hypothetical protein
MDQQLGTVTAISSPAGNAQRPERQQRIRYSRFDAQVRYVQHFDFTPAGRALKTHAVADA